MTQTADISHPRTGIWRHEQRSHSNRSEDGHKEGGMDSHSPRLNQATANSEYSPYEQQRPTLSPWDRALLKETNQSFGGKLITLQPFCLRKTCESLSQEKTLLLWVCFLALWTSFCITLQSITEFLIPTTQYLTKVSHYSEGHMGVSLDHGIP